MDLELNPTQIIIGAILWLAAGAAFDLFSLTLSTTGKVSSSLSKRIRVYSGEQKDQIKSLSTQEVETRLIKPFLDELKNALRGGKEFFLIWANNFFRNVVARSPAVGNAEKADADEDGDRYTNHPGSKEAGQKLLGAMLEFVMLAGFMYADAAQGAQTLSTIFTTTIVPRYLNDIVIPLIIASAGTAFILGVFLGDLLGLANLGNWGVLPKRLKGIFLWVVILNFLITLFLSALIALHRIEILGIENPTLHEWGIYAQSLIIVPMLITTLLLSRGIYGVLVILAVLFWLASLPFGIMEYLIGIFNTLVELGFVSVIIIAYRLAWLATAAIELVFSLLEIGFKYLAWILIYMIAVVFYIPYLLVNIPLQHFFGKRIVGFFNDMVVTSLEDTEERANEQGKKPESDTLKAAPINP